jgi:hypothetical protein
MGKIRAAKLSSSKRMQDVFWLLADGHLHSTKEISRYCDRYAINSIVAELRAKPNELSLPKAKCRDGAYWYRMVRDAKFFEWRRKLWEQELLAVRVG